MSVDIHIFYTYIVDICTYIYVYLYIHILLLNLVAIEPRKSAHC